ncbi:DUF4297 domain-containing protein [Cronobacter turicensis]|uniref:dsDNA nuclease domain-containing protein n=1 Tax=Cronobacter turicensis TaxID=413502 RepID=UPI001412C95E|nr:DUF4297 domain-containing protein [Cronobacter turicensis]NHV62598.1 DUF4297 domain-containing protein [Cronobacter turicensis]NHW09539.1 DUF4297 domain-containing protein [Cronobacter turicensis]HDI3034363.1 DUF4297 domain-containing protein [Cronobacter turicensis]
MRLSEALVSVDQAERGGENALRGFKYQASWGINYLLEKQKTKSEYLFLFEYHDDILVLNSCDNPTSAEFIQVKTKKDGKWTLAAISNASKTKPKSFVAKLYDHFFQFKDHAVSMILLSNAGFDFLDGADEKGTDLSEQNKRILIQKIQEQLSTSEDIPLDRIKFNTSDLSLLDPHSHLYGKVSVFLNSYFNDDHGINPTSFTDLLINKCNERVRVPSGDIKNFQDLVERKAVSSRFVSDLLAGLVASIKMNPQWAHVCMLINDFQDPYEKIRLQAIFSRISVKILNVNSVYYSYFVQNQFVLKEQSNRNEIPVRELFAMVDEAMMQKKCSEFSLLDKDEKFMITLYNLIKLTFEGISNEG